MAAGNNGMSAPTYPAVLRARDRGGRVATTTACAWRFSNYGPNVDVMAPGDSIWSTYPPGGYGFMSGTSMAAPHAAGVAALLLSVNPNLTPAQIKDRLQTTATDMDAPGVDQLHRLRPDQCPGRPRRGDPGRLRHAHHQPEPRPWPMDVNGNGLVDPGDTLRYLVTVANAGATAARRTW